jgi:hypothetical protein
MKAMKTMNMKQTFSGKWMPGNIIIVIIAALVMTCMSITAVIRDDSVKAGEVTVFQVKVEIRPNGSATGTRLIMGFLAPKSWNAAANTTVTYTSGTYENGVQTMSIVPAGTVPKDFPDQAWPAAIRNKYSYGENVLDDMEWIVYWSDKTYDIQQGVDIDAYVSIAAKAGPQNLSFKPTFFVDDTEDGLHDNTRYGVFKTDCFVVTDGEGDLIDFCELHFNAAQPLTATKDDFITLDFQGDVGPNNLIQADAIYLCATAYTDKGSVLTVCGAEDKNRMKKQFQFGNAYTITLWPGGYFNVPADESIEKIEYYFSNTDGSVVMKDGPTNTETPFVYNMKCQ